MSVIAAFVPAACIVLLAYIVFGISGFGSTLIAVPLLAHLHPLTVVIPVVVLLDCVGSISMGLRLRADVYRQELLPLLPFMLLGMIAGVFLLVRTPGAILLLALGVFVLAYGTLYLLRRDGGFRLARLSAAPIGLFAGTTSSVFGVGGPIYVMYLTGRGAGPDHIRATIPVIFIFTTIGRIGLFAVAGLFTREVLQLAALLLPLMLLGLYAGNRLHGRLTREHVVRAVGVLLMASGVTLIARALAA
jgi:uncharacterized membrane protein YfcA